MSIGFGTNHIRNNTELKQTTFLECWNRKSHDSSIKVQQFYRPKLVMVYIKYLKMQSVQTIKLLFVNLFTFIKDSFVYVICSQFWILKLHIDLEFTFQVFSRDWFFKKWLTIRLTSVSTHWICFLASTYFSLNSLYSSSFLFRSSESF